MKTKSSLSGILSLTLAAILAFVPVCFGGGNRALAEDTAIVAIGNQSTRPGGTVTFTVSFSSETPLKSIGISDVAVSGSGMAVSNEIFDAPGALMASWDDGTKFAVATWGEAAIFDGPMLTFDVSVGEDILPGEYDITMLFQPRNAEGKLMKVTYTGGKLTVLDAYEIKYDANGGSGAPAAQTKIQGTDLNLSSTKPTKKYTVTYNANGGSVSTASKKVSCTFKSWNTAKNGSGTTYQAGGVYAADSAATLYAQYSNPTAGTLAEPAREGFVFDGWFTAADGGTKVTSSTTIKGNTTIYAHWSERDIIAPTGAIISADNPVTGQTVTLTLADNKGVAGYYWGTGANYADNDFTAAEAGSVNVTVSEAGTYYLVVKDTSGNLSEAVSATFFMLGDLNNDGFVDDDDAIYLLFNSFFADSYPLNQNGDFNKDGFIDDDDAIYLLFYSFFPESYPLS